jgi:hypothetical protein
MNIPLERSPSSDPPGSRVTPQVLPVNSEALLSTADSEQLVRNTPKGDSLHTVSAIYPTRAEADGVRLHLIERGFASSEIRILADLSESLTWPDADEKGPDGVLKTVLLDGAIGTAVGTGVGVAGTVAIAAAGITLFVASPVVAPLAMIGWFASLGGVVGAAVGADRKKDGDERKGKISDLVTDAIEAGSTALVVRTHNDAERELATRTITDSLQGTDQIPAQS